MGVITGRLVGASGPTALPVPTVGQVVENVTALRALVGSTALPAVTLRQYAAAGPNLGGGVFMWDAVSRVDDGVLRFNAGGLASSAAGWQRVVDPGIVCVTWAGAVADGATDDTAAVAAAMAALGTVGGVLKFPVGTTMVDAEVLNFDGPADGVSSVTLRGVTRGVGQYGSGSVIKARGAGAYLVRFAGQNMRAEHLTLHGGSETEGGAAVDAVVFFDYQSIGSGLLDCTVRGGRNAAPIVVTPDHTTETFTATAHGLANGAQIYLTTTSGLPAGLYNVGGRYNRVWFVVNRTDDTFQISATSGGAAQAFSSNGVGTISATEIGGHDWGHLVRIGGASGLQADTGFITNCIIGEGSHLVGRSLFFSDGNALIWHVTNTTIWGGIDTIYNRGGSFVLSSVNFYPTPAVSRSHILKDGPCGTVSIGGASYSEADAVPFIDCLPGGSEYSPGWAVHDMQFATGRAHVHWDCYQPLLMQQMGGSLYVTASGTHFVSCVGTSTDYQADAELGRIYGDTSKVVRFGHRERGEGPQTVARRLSGVPGVYGGSAKHGQGLFLDGGAPSDDSLRMHGPTVVDLGKYGAGNQTAGLVLGRRLASANVDSVDHTVDRITKTGHGLGWGESVRFATTGTMPGGLLTSLDYWVKPVTGDVFEVALERNGDTVALTSNGSGTLSYSALKEGLIVCQDNNSWRGDEIRFSSGLPCSFYAPTLAFGVAAEITLNHGTGSPEGAVVGNVGDVYHRTDGGTGTTLYVKESGAGTAVGWRPCMSAVGALAPGSESYGDGQWYIQYRRLQLTSTQRLTLAGTARYILTDL